MADNKTNDTKESHPDVPFVKQSKFGNPASFRNQNFKNKGNQAVIKNTGPAMRHKV